MRKILCVLAVFGLGACASAPGQKFEMPKTQVRNDMTRLVLYRTGFTMMPENTAVLIDGAPTCYIEPGEVFVRDIRPGTHKLALDTPNSPGTSVLSFTAVAGRTTYISAARNARSVAAGILLGPIADYVTSDKTSARGGNVFLEEVSASTAEQETASLSRCSCSPPGS